MSTTADAPLPAPPVPTGTEGAGVVAAPPLPDDDPDAGAPELEARFVASMILYLLSFFTSIYLVSWATYFTPSAITGYDVPEGLDK